MENKWRWQIPAELERDVWFYCNKFGLNRTGFRALMRSSVIYNKVHALSYDTVTAQQLLDALKDGYEFSMAHGYQGSDSEYISRKRIVNCMNRLKRIIDSEINPH